MSIYPEPETALDLSSLVLIWMGVYTSDLYPFSGIFTVNFPWKTMPSTNGFLRVSSRFSHWAIQCSQGSPGYLQAIFFAHDDYIWGSKTLDQLSDFAGVSPAINPPSWNRGFPREQRLMTRGYISISISNYIRVDIPWLSLWWSLLSFLLLSKPSYTIIIVIIDPMIYHYIKPVVIIVIGHYSPPLSWPDSETARQRPRACRCRPFSSNASSSCKVPVPALRESLGWFQGLGSHLTGMTHGIYGQ